MLLNSPSQSTCQGARRIDGLSPASTARCLLARLHNRSKDWRTCAKECHVRNEGDKNETWESPSHSAQHICQCNTVRIAEYEGFHKNNRGQDTRTFYTRSSCLSTLGTNTSLACGTGWQSSALALSSSSACPGRQRTTSAAAACLAG